MTPQGNVNAIGVDDGTGVDSWQRKATSGETYSGLRASMSSGGMTVAVMRVPATGAMVFT